MTAFVGFPKIARLSRNIMVTEKIDGTNAQVHIRRIFDPETGAVREYLESGVDTQVHLEDGSPALVRAGSRSRWISTADDNFGFAKWVYANAHQLAALGEGSHFGEWWGLGIQRGYGMEHKRFSLFNAARWTIDNSPECCDVVPILYEGMFSQVSIDGCIDGLRNHGSVASPGYMNPEGIIVWHEAARIYFKKTLHKDDEWNGKVAA